MPRTAHRRSLWLTVPLYVAMLGIIALDVWTVGFWARVGGSLGWAVVVVQALVASILTLLLRVDARRQGRLVPGRGGGGRAMVDGSP